LRGTFDGIDIDVLIEEGVTLGALRSYGADVNLAIPELLSIAARVVTAARGGIQTREFERDLEAAVTTTTAAINAARDYFERTVSPDGTVSALLRSSLDGMAATWNVMLADHANPAKSGSLVASLQAQATRLQETLASDHRKLLVEFQQHAQDHSERLNRAVRDIRDVDPASGLGVKLAQIERGLSEVQVALTVLRTAQETEKQLDAARPHAAADGVDFEKHAVLTIAGVSRLAGDSCEHVGGHPGVVRAKSGMSKAGDIVTALAGGEDLNIVWEAKDRAKKDLTRRNALAWAEEAKQNRRAKVAIIVVPGAENALMASQPYQRLSDTVWVIALPVDAADADLERLEIVYHWARYTALALKRSEPRGLGKDAIEEHARAVLQKVEQSDGLRRHLSNASKSIEDSRAVLERMVREIRESMFALTGLLADEESGEPAHSFCLDD
jgi:hypothetical protein